MVITYNYQKSLVIVVINQLSYFGGPTFYLVHHIMSYFFWLRIYICNINGRYLRLNMTKAGSPGTSSLGGVWKFI